VLSVGMLAEQPVRLWQSKTARGKAFFGVVTTMRHPCIPERDLTPGLPTWMRSDKTRVDRQGADAGRCAPPSSSSSPAPNHEGPF